MEFNQRVTEIIMKTDPTREPITPEQYAALDEKEQRHYGPDYLKYRTTRRRAYDTCYECGNTTFAGWEEVQIPVGEPYRYVSHALITEVMVDRLLEPNILMARIMGKQLYGDEGDKS